MDFLKDTLPSLPKQKKIVLAVSAILMIAALIAVIYLLSDKKDTPAIYDYNAMEQQIADSVKAYLSLYLELPDEISAQIADEAVENYNIIMTSGAYVISDEHTETIKQRIRKAISTLTENTTELTEDELDSLAAGIIEIIWKAILSQIEEVTVTNDYEQEYIQLKESIQKQIDELAEQKMRITVSASIKDSEDSSDNIDAAAALGLSPEELKKLLEANNLDLNKELEEKLAALKKEMLDELLAKYGNTNRTQQNSTVGQNGTNGKNGKDGADGKNGKDGADGEDGLNGKTTYIAYADDMFGSGFSLTPTETSKYVGTCITDLDSQPTDYASYSNWQIYRTYIITTTTDDNGVTTVHIN